MTNEEKVQLFRKIVNDMADLYEKKNKNYGNSFGKLYEDLGPIAGIVPLHNKLDRITNLIKGDTNNFESLEDSFKDLACYAIMNLIESENAQHSNEDGDGDGNDPCLICTKHKGWNGELSPCATCPHHEFIDDAAYYAQIIDDSNKTSTSNIIPDAEWIREDEIKEKENR